MLITEVNFNMHKIIRGCLFISHVIYTRELFKNTRLRKFDRVYLFIRCNLFHLFIGFRLAMRFQLESQERIHPTSQSTILRLVKDPVKKTRNPTRTREGRGWMGWGY